MKVLIVGAGGIGGYFGARLIEAGVEITFLLRPARKALIDAQGLTIETPTGPLQVRPHSILAEEVKPGFDLILLAPKAFDLDDALQALDHAGPNAYILPFLNGMAHLDVLDQRFGKERVLGGVAQIAATITPSGAVRQLTELHHLTVGPRTVGQEPLARGFIALCEQANFDHLYSEQIEQALWDKWVFLATLAAMTTLCRAAVGAIVASPYGRELTQALYAECCAIAQANGYPVAQATQTKSLKLLTREGSSFTASMLRDLVSGQKTEHEHILGDLARRADRVQVACPILKASYTPLAVAASASGFTTPVGQPAAN